MTFGSKRLGSRRTSATGTRKGQKDHNTKDEENQPVIAPTHPSSLPNSPATRTTPRPRPVRRNPQTSDTLPQPFVPTESAEAAAAQALVAMALPTTSSTRSAQYDHIFNQTTGSNIHMEEEEMEEMEKDPDAEEEELSSGDERAGAIRVPADTDAEDDEVIDVMFKVPFENAERNVEGITTHTKFWELLALLSKQMNVPITHLTRLGFIASFYPKSPKPKATILEDNSWRSLRCEILAHVTDSRKKNKGKGVVKPFHITCEDTSSSAAQKGNKKATSTATTQGAAAASAAAVLGADELREVRFQREIEAEWLCPEHKKSCLPLIDGQHYHLTDADLVSWAQLVVNHKATVKEPPYEHLGIKEKAVRQRGIKKGFTPSAANDQADPPKWMQDMLLAATTIFGGMRTGVGSTMLPIPPVDPPTNPAPASTSGTGASLVPQKRNAPIVYPSVEEWLMSVDTDPARRKQDLFYLQYLHSLTIAGFDDLVDLSRMNKQEFLAICGMSLGVAKRMVAFVKEDMDNIAKCF
ncbi:hypothetical protein OF83DRAFT_1180264 [Amylostereum chailletii]|nr:hypothetical protein OF83DRAFT_1180264 [Amylostereum chailletii]